MGTWDIGFFDNDMACDWENSLKEEVDLYKIEEPLNMVISSTEDTLDIDIANRALAAAEALARLILKDGESSSYTANIDIWVKDYSDNIPAYLTNMAIKAIKRTIQEDSELYQFWKLRPEFDIWIDNINKLKIRLSSSI